MAATPAHAFSPLLLTQPARTLPAPEVAPVAVAFADDPAVIVTNGPPNPPPVSLNVVGVGWIFTAVVGTPVEVGAGAVVV